MPNFGLLCTWSYFIPGTMAPRHVPLFLHRLTLCEQNYFLLKWKKRHQTSIIMSTFLPHRAMLGTSWIVQVLYLHQVQQNYHLSVYSAVGCHLPFTVVKHRTTTNYKGHIILACLNTAEPCLCLRGLDNHSSLQHRTLKSRCGVCPVFFVHCLLHSHCSKNTNILFWFEKHHV